MTITIKNQNGVELLNSAFSNIGIDGKIYSITLATDSVLDLGIETDKIYNVIFSNADGLGLSGTFIMTYLSYHFSASTAFLTNELGETVPTIVVNSNTITLKKY